MGYFTLHVYVYIMRVHIVNAILEEADTPWDTLPLRYFDSKVHGANMGPI